MIFKKSVSSQHTHTNQKKAYNKKNEKKKKRKRIA